jgi:hypothetical protein
LKRGSASRSVERNALVSSRFRPVLTHSVSYTSQTERERYRHRALPRTLRFKRRREREREREREGERWTKMCLLLHSFPFVLSLSHSRFKAEQSGDDHHQPRAFIRYPLPLTKRLSKESPLGVLFALFFVQLLSKISLSLHLFYPHAIVQLLTESKRKQWQRKRKNAVYDCHSPPRCFLGHPPLPHGRRWRA